MKILLHSCCGPCTIYPLEVLRSQGIEVEGYFYNPNIHPYKEFLARKDSYHLLAQQEKLTIHVDENYGLHEFIKMLQGVSTNSAERCQVCYTMRMETTAIKAKELDLDGFSTTLLVSPYQNQSLLIQSGEAAADKYGVRFIGQDYREGFRSAQGKAREMGLYRQAYCGCIFSEYDRYRPRRGDKE